MAHVFNSSTQVAETGRSLFLVYRGSFRTARKTQRIPSEKINKNNNLVKNRLVLGLVVWACNQSQPLERPTREDNNFKISFADILRSCLKTKTKCKQ